MDQESRSLNAVQARLLSGEAISDAEVLRAALGFEAAVRTNCDAAAEALFAAVAPLCAVRPHLAPQLLRLPVRPLYYLGLDDAEHCVQWLTAYLQRAEHYVPLHETGRRWLSDVLLARPDLLHDALNAVRADEETSK